MDWHVIRNLTKFCWLHFSIDIVTSQIICQQLKWILAQILPTWWRISLICLIKVLEWIRIDLRLWFVDWKHNLSKIKNRSIDDKRQRKEVLKGQVYLHIKRAKFHGKEIFFLKQNALLTIIILSIEIIGSEGEPYHCQSDSNGNEVNRK